MKFDTEDPSLVIIVIVVAVNVVVVDLHAVADPRIFMVHKYSLKAP